MIEQILHYIRSHIDEFSSISENQRFLSLPIVYQEEYRAYTLKLLDNEYTLVQPRTDLVRIDALKKHINTITTVTGQAVILYIPHLSDHRIKSLIRERISFTNGQSNLYIYPNLIISKYKKIGHFNPKLSATAQSIIRYFLLIPSLSLNVQEAAKLIELSEMSASRGLKELNSHGFIHYTITGKTGRIKAYQINKDSDIFQRILLSSQSPIKRVVFVKEVPDKAVLSGYSALCARTNMQDDGIERYAMNIRGFDQLKINFQEDPFDLRMNEYHELELWSYVPSIHGQSIIDDFSLVCLFKDDKEARIEIELDELMRRHEWSMDYNDS